MPRRNEASDVLPPLYAPWLEALVGGPLPAETSATCHACPMLPDDDARGPHDALTFHPGVKCCTYVPELPNFLVGHVLLDRSAAAAAGRQSVVERVRAAVGVSPLGLEPPPTFLVLYRAGGGDTFGRAPDLRCPHYQTASGGCGIWRHRHAVCTTWFCKHARGAVGSRFWASVRALLLALERALAVHCVRSLLTDAAALRELFEPPHPLATTTLRPPDLGGADDGRRARRIWGPYAGRELDFYEACGRLVTRRMTWTALQRLGGVELRVSADLVREEYRRLRSTEIPGALRVGTIEVRPEGRDRVHLTAFSAYEPLSVPRHLFDVLHLFDGRPTRAAIAAAKAAGVDVNRAAVRRLVDFGILVDAARP